MIFLPVWAWVLVGYLAGFFVTIWLFDQLDHGERSEEVMPPAFFAYIWPLVAALMIVVGVVGAPYFLYEWMKKEKKKEK